MLHKYYSVAKQMTTKYIFMLCLLKIQYFLCSFCIVCSETENLYRIHCKTLLLIEMYEDQLIFCFWQCMLQDLYRLNDFLVNLKRDFRFIFWA